MMKVEIHISDGERFVGTVSLGVKGLYVRKYRFLRKDKLVAYIPYSSIISYKLRKSLLRYRIEISFISGYRVNHLIIYGDGRLKDMYEKMRILRMYSII